MPILLILLLLQPTIFGHFMGEQVIKYNPTKFAMMENAKQTYYDPILATIAYGDPSHPIVGFDELYNKCKDRGNKTLGELAKEVGVDERTIIAVGEEIGIKVKNDELKKVLKSRIGDVCFLDVKKAEERMGLVHTLYYAKLVGGIVAFISIIAFTSLVYDIPALSLILRPFGNRLFTLSLLIAAGSITASTLGWAVREIGRKPWTVYGLLYPEEVVSANTIALSPLFVLTLSLIILAVGFGGIIAMYIIATRELRRRG